VKHNPAFVRINPFDGTLHCDRHGLLNADETVQAIAAAGVTAQDGIAIDGRTPRVVAWVLDRWGRFRHGEACQP
jgi:hypothetical protein